MTYLEVLNRKYGVVFTPTMKTELEGFDQKIQYGGKYDSYNLSLTSHRILVGKVGNLIRDMYNAGASEAELVRAIKYGLVVIDTVKYGLDYKQAKADLGISELYKKYKKAGIDANN